MRSASASSGGSVDAARTATADYVIDRRVHRGVVVGAAVHADIVGNTNTCILSRGDRRDTRRCCMEFISLGNFVRYSS